MIRRFWWVIAAAVILTAGVIYAGSSLHGLPDLVRVVGSVAWLAGAAGLFAKGASVVLGPGAKAGIDRHGNLLAELPAARQAQSKTAV